MLIIADQTIPYLRGVLEPYGEVRYLASSEFIPANVREAEILIVRSIDKCSRELLERSRVRLITTATIGYDHIDTAYCEKAGIVWRNAPGCNANSVAQYVMSSLLLLASREGCSLKGKTIGIIGVGHVGQKVEQLCRSYGMRVLLNDPPRADKEGAAGFTSLQHIAEEADIVTFHTPLTKTGEYTTYHLAGEAFFAQCKRNPWFINASRGGVHDTQALSDAWKKGGISRMILDCWEHEPHIDPELLSMVDIATPHIAGFSADGKSNATRMCLEYINEFYDLKIEGLEQIQPPPPANPFIDLNQFKGNRMEQAFLTTYNPEETDRKLRANPDQFEWFRSHYDHPREPHAYTLLHATPEETKLGKALGFGIG